ncbi:MAG: hypothetical protein ABEH43_09120, partial [Flavobacteriales bacterium]
MNDYFKKEAKARKPEFSYDVESLRFFEKFNDSLLDMNDNLFRINPSPNINFFVMGLPRSGTTLLTQLLYNTLDIDCINHFVAKFWKTPLVGCYFSKYFLNNQNAINYSSKYAKSWQIRAPHEFSWFWHRAFLIDIGKINEYNPVQVE